MVGGGGYAISLFGRLLPRLTDLAMEATGFSAQTTDRAPRPERADSLHRTKKGGTERSLTSPVAPVRKTLTPWRAACVRVLFQCVASCAERRYCCGGRAVSPCFAPRAHIVAAYRGCA